MGRGTNIPFLRGRHTQTVMSHDIQFIVNLQVFHNNNNYGTQMKVTHMSSNTLANHH